MFAYPIIHLPDIINLVTLIPFPLWKKGDHLSDG